MALDPVNSEAVHQASQILEAAAKAGMKAEVIENPTFTGYRQLTDNERELVEWIKRFGVGLGDMIADLAGQPDTDKRWVGIAATHFQQGLMAATRSVTRPTTFA